MNIDDILGQLPDMNKQQSTGGGPRGDYTPPPEGVALLRCISYIELGRHLESYQGDEKKVEKVQIVFELHGKNYPVKADGQPHRITVTETLSMHEKANFKKLFLQMRNGDESVKHFAQLVGRPFKGRVYHKSWKDKDGNQKTFARLRNDVGYSVGPAVSEDPESGEVRVINVPEALSSPKIFLWNFATQDSWDALMDSTKVKIREALNYQGSKAQQLDTGVSLPEIPAKQPERKSFNPAGRFNRGTSSVVLTPGPTIDFGDDVFGEGAE